MTLDIDVGHGFDNVLAQTHPDLVGPVVISPARVWKSSTHPDPVSVCFDDLDVRSSEPFRGSCLGPGDLNCDDEINALDIEPFLVALFDPGQYPIQYPTCDINLGDINGDGDINALDIEPFLELLFP